MEKLRFVHSLSLNDRTRIQTECGAKTPLTVIEQIEIAFRVVDESAVPLALERQVVLGGPTIPLDHLASNVGALVAISLEDGSSIFKRIGVALPAPLAHLRQFESIGGLGFSQVFAVGREQTGMRRVWQARRIIGVLYNV